MSDPTNPTDNYQLVAVNVSPVTNVLRIVLCLGCGSMVYDTDAHDAFHAALSAVAQRTLR